MNSKRKFPIKVAGGLKPSLMATVSLVVLLVALLVAAPSSYAADAPLVDLSGLTNGINQVLGGLGINVQNQTTVTNPLNNITTTPQTTTQPTTSAADVPGYGGYANGDNAAAILPADLGMADAGLSTSEINSAGNIVPNWDGTPQDESKATAAGVNEPLGLRIAGIPISLGSNGSAAAPDSGLIGRMADLTVPLLGRVQLGFVTSNSTASSTNNGVTILLLNVDALDFSMAIPVGQSSSSVSRTGTKVTSDSSSALIGQANGDPLVIGSGVLGNSNALALKVLAASSSSNADGTAASNTNSWTLADLSVAGIPVLLVDSANGAELAGAKLIPATNGSLLAIDQIAGLAGIYIGETWSETDGKSFAFGGANTVRVSLLSDESFLVLGHAGTGANAISANGPGAGPDMTTEGPDGSNIPPSAVSPPNNVPTGNVIPPKDIGPGPDPKPNPDPTPNPFGPGDPGNPGTTVTPTPTGTGVPQVVTQFFANMLPNTGAAMLVWLMLLGGSLITTAIYLYNRAKKAQVKI